MGSVARGIAGAAALLVVACAAIAGIDEPGADRPPPGSRSGDSDDASRGDVPGTPTGGSSGTPDSPDPSAPDGGVDASPPPTPACPPPQKPDGERCQDAGECCSDACREDLRCGPACKPNGERCGFGSTSECCIGLWCGGSTLTQCTPCIPKGDRAATRVSVILEHSCCSRSVNFGSGRCN
ncbi:MAG: hypothetical protein KF894_06060 [Labilithrix sp.]|nr:hypothetical protein [Labilithrix sp.]